MCRMCASTRPTALKSSRSPNAKMQFCILGFAAVLVGLVCAQEAAQMVCAPQMGCIEGQVTSKAGVRISMQASSNATNATSALLLPGTYSYPLSGNGSALVEPLLQASNPTLSPGTGFTLSQTSNSGSSFSVLQNPDAGLVIYSSSQYSGQVSSLSFNDSVVQNVTAGYTPLSFLMAQDVRAVVEVPISGGQKKRLTLWQGAPDTNELPVQLAGGAWTIEDLQGSTCSPACSSGGFCSLDGKCICKTGFTGPTCSACLPATFGPTCSPCSPDCTGKCDEGITGTGRCIPNEVKPAADACNCENGVCDGAGNCACQTGWMNPSGSGKACSVCAQGFYLSSQGECLACAPGCTACAASTGACSTCSSGLQVSSDNPQTCIAERFLPTNGTSFTSCPDGQFSSSGVCKGCSSACQTCFGAGQDQCLSCAQGRGVLQGRCVAVDASTGLCDGSAIQGGSALGFVYDNDKKACDALPTGCTAGTVPGFSAASKRSDIKCTKCLSGLLLDNGHCITKCDDGFFPSGSGDTMTCEACDSSCATCQGSAGFCLSCPAGSFAIAGKCVATLACPSGTFQPNATLSACSPCHPDCATCAGAPDQCASCSSSRPVLTEAKSCTTTCSSSQYLDEASGLCKGCDSSCGSCAGSGPAQCLSCSNNAILRGGACVPATCSNTVLGLCLADFAAEQSKSAVDGNGTASKKVPSWVYYVIAIGVVVLLLLVGILLRIRAVRKRMEQTKGFQEKKGMLAAFFGRKPKPTPPQSEAGGSSHWAAQSEYGGSHAGKSDSYELTRTATPPPYSSSSSQYWVNQKHNKHGLAPPSAFSSVRSHTPSSEAGSYRSELHPPKALRDSSASSTISTLSGLPPPMLPNHTGSSNGSRNPFLHRPDSRASSAYSSNPKRHAKEFVTTSELEERRKAFDQLTTGRQW